MSNDRSPLPKFGAVRMPTRERSERARVSTRVHGCGCGRPLVKNAQKPFVQRCLEGNTIEIAVRYYCTAPSWRKYGPKKGGFLRNLTPNICSLTSLHTQKNGVICTLLCCYTLFLHTPKYNSYTIFLPYLEHFFVKQCILNLCYRGNDINFRVFHSQG